MEPLYIEGTKNTPEVVLDKSKEVFQIKGWSKPENTIQFYEPILKWLTEYTKNSNPSTAFTFNLDYFNSSSSKILLHIIQILEQLPNSGSAVKVIWCYTDEDNLEAGQAYESLSRIPFTFVDHSGS